MLHLIADGLSINARRRLQFEAHVAFIDGKTKRNETKCFFIFSFVEHFLYPEARDVKNEAKEFVENKLKHPLHIRSIDDNDEDFRRLIFDRTKSLTGKEELIRRRRFSIELKNISIENIFFFFRRLKLLFDIAERENCTKLILGDHCTKLAAQILSDIAQGRGAHVASECVKKRKQTSNETFFLRIFRI